ncbi:hypothetical protein [Paenibacillus sp. Root444D2]|uniref:hypothetical protein n=1 Tax=Paenibacillus sp. Root444D2 TaxID=1736538 RepID=UPI00070E350F|nr:hypothetical protein [Paenibacillus sp. Root444D2]KQX69211.1 hypothetical protein ASD40_01555 [Paenibacillus sp. Root444D2]
MKIHPNRSGLTRRLAKAFANEIVRDKKKQRGRKQQRPIVANKSTKEKMSEAWNNIGYVVAFIILITLIIKVVDAIKLIFHIE